MLALPMAGCASYRDHNDTIATSAGDAVYANAAIHTIDPWPAVAANTDIPSAGSHVRTSVEKYLQPQKAPATPVATDAAAPAGN